MQIGQAQPYVESFSIARSAASSIFSIIDRLPTIDSASKKGNIPSPEAGNITFRNVHFNYPSRKEVKVSPDEL